MTRTNYCPICGTSNPSTAQKCRRCGAPLAQSSYRPLEPSFPATSPFPTTSKPSVEETDWIEPAVQRDIIQTPSRRDWPVSERAQPQVRPTGVTAGEPAIEGTVIEVVSSQEPPDPDWARVLFGLLMVVDFILIFGSMVLGFVLGGILAVIIASLVGLGGIIGAILGMIWGLLSLYFALFKPNRERSLCSCRA